MFFPAGLKKLLLLLTIACFIFSSCRQQQQKNAPAKKQARVPATEDVVLYEVFVHNFSAEGTLKAIIPQLNRIRDLGINTLWLMPIQPIGTTNRKGTYGSPYSIANYTEVNPDLGTKNDFRALVDSIHAKGMFIILDEVANHTAWNHPWVKAHPDWYTQDSTGKIIWPKGTDWNDVADLNYDNKDMRMAQIAAMKFWIDSFNIDGYRCDAAMMVPDDFWKQAIDSLRKLRPIIMLCEDEDSSDYTVDGFDMNYGWRMYHAVKDVWNGKQPVAFIDSVWQQEHATLPANYRALRFIDNHDENSWDEVPEKKFVNPAGAKAAFFTMVTLPGTPLVYNGQEVGYPTRINLFEKYSIDWSARPDLQQWYARLLNFYDGSEVLKRGVLDAFSASDGVMIYRRKILGADPLWVVVNAHNKEALVNLPETLQHKKFVDVITQEGMALDTVMKLRPFEHHLLKVL